MAVPLALTESLRRVAAATPFVQTLILYGSRARDEARPDSDWDFGYIGERGLDVDGLLAQLIETLGTDRVDLVDLDRASGLLRYRAARDGRLLYERADGMADAFRLAAVAFWCDTAPLFEDAYEGILETLDR